MMNILIVTKDSQTCGKRKERVKRRTKKQREESKKGVREGLRRISTLLKKSSSPVGNQGRGKVNKMLRSHKEAIISILEVVREQKEMVLIKKVILKIIQ